MSEYQADKTQSQSLNPEVPTITNLKTVFQFKETKLRTETIQELESMGYNQETGYLIRPEDSIEEKLSIYSEARKYIGQNDEQFLQEIKKLSLLKVQLLVDFREKIAARETVSYLVQCYLRIKKEATGENNAQIVLPFSLAKPLCLLSDSLGLKYGMTTGQNYNWIINENVNWDDLHITDIKLRNYFTNAKYQELLFFGATIAGGLYMSKCVKLCLEINELYQNQHYEWNQITGRLKMIAFYIKRICCQNEYMKKHLDQDYFYDILRPNVTGFENVIFEGIDDGKDKAISSNGGNGGYDPMFQIFEKFFGITFDEQYQKVSSSLHEGMPNNSQKMMQFAEKNSIRKECQKEACMLAQAYNEVISQYSLFYQGHSSIIQHFIIARMIRDKKDVSQGKGVSGIKFSSIMDRWHRISEQKIKYKVQKIEE